MECVIGLPEDYKNVADQIENKDTTHSLAKIHERLLNHEAKLQSATLQQTIHPVS